VLRAGGARVQRLGESGEVAVPGAGRFRLEVFGSGAVGIDPDAGFG